MMSECPQLTESEFWEKSAQRRCIRDYARHTRTSPDAVLGAVLARVATVAPPNVVAPAFTGVFPSSLAIYVAIVGNSGDGKGLAEGVARQLVPDLLGAGETLPVSGEGLVTLFAGRRPLPDDDGETRVRRTELYCTNQRALLSVPEIGNLGAAMGRIGSTLEPVLLSAWSGEPLGGQNVDEAKRLRAPSYGYRLNLVTGVQPVNSDILADRDGSGLPQRFLWCDTRDHEAPAERPSVPIEKFTFDVDRLRRLQPSDMTLNDLYRSGARERMSRMESGEDPYPLHVMRYPDEVRDAVDRDRVRALHGERPDGMDAHSLLLTVRIAGLIAILEQRENLLTVTLDDWLAARWLVAHSVAVRGRCILEGRRIDNRKRASKVADGIESKNLGQRIAKERKEQDRQARLSWCLEWVPEYLSEKDPARIGIGEGVLRNAITDANKPYLTESLSRLLEMHIIEERQGERGGKRYALTTYLPR